MNKYVDYFFNTIIPKNEYSILSYLITGNCNSKCMTCNIWNGDCFDNSQISVTDLEKILKVELFKNIRHVGISGGEPSTTWNLVEYIEVLIRNLLKLSTISITTNSLNAEFWKENIGTIYNDCRKSNVNFTINLSLDGIGEVHDRIRGVSGAFSSFLSIFNFIRDHNLPHQLHTTISSSNVYHLPAILNFAQKNKSPILFRVASPIARLKNQELNALHLEENEKSFCADFLISEQVMNYTKNINRKLFYRFLASFLIGKTQHRRAPCFFKKNGLVLNYNGELYECSRFETPVVDFFEENKSVVSVKSTTFKRTQSEHEQCTACFHDQNGYWPINSIIREIANKFLAKFFKLAIFMKYFCLFLKNEYLTPQCRLQPVGNDILIIGMYGGEHVGDAAILGGVIDRIKTQHTINKIYVSSFRVDRTKCWAANLTFQNDIEVIGYSLKEIASVLKSTKFVLWGGGPIMDLPNLLMHHLSVVSLTKKSNVPLLIEGVGIGPIKSKICGFLVKHILKRSAAITVRTTNDQSFLKSFSNKKSTVIGDPAFIYLKNVDFLALSDKSYQYIEPLVRMFENRRIIGLNIRPLWEKYSTICIDEIKNRYIVEIKNASNTLIDKGYAVIFFAMNADQYGFSDLSFGHELAGNVKSEYFKVLDYENTIESAIYLINKCHAIVSSRFHACIFAISQRKPIIGIDYSIGKPGKISYLLNEYSMSDRIIRVEEINGDVISKKVQEI